ncbi:MAG: lysophospholipid acyltransferase family protein, partial [Nevskiales bacterium]
MTLLLKLLGSLPLPFLHLLGALAGSLLWWLPNKRKRVALRNIGACLPELSPAEQRHLARRALTHEAQTLLECPYLWFAPAEKVSKLIRERRGTELVSEALKQGKGVILLTAHLGSWEAAGMTQPLLHPMTGLYKPQEGKVEQLMYQGRSRFGVKLVSTDGGKMRQVLRPLLENHETVYFMPDQDPPEGRGVFVPFFGVNAHTPVLVSKLVRHTGAPVVYFYGERLPWGRGFIVHYRPAPPEIHDPDLMKSAAAVNAGIEACIREHPEQYWWGYE